METTLRIEQRDPEGVPFREAEIKALRLAGRVAGAKQLQVLAAQRLVLRPQGLELLRHEARLQLRERLGPDQPDQSPVRVHQYDVLVKAFAMPRQRAVQDQPDRGV